MNLVRSRDRNTHKLSSTIVDMERSRSTSKGMKVALVHDYLIDFGGAERVLVALHEIYPEAPIYVSILDKKGLGEHWEEFKNANIKYSWFNSLPFSSRLISPLRFLLPLIWKSFDLSEYDLIIDSSSWAVARGFKTRKGQFEVCYCHTPPRYLYGYDTSRKLGDKWYGGLIKFYALIVNHFMRMYDFNSAQKVDYFIANSKNVAARIQKFYRRDSVIIYPPVDMLSRPPSDIDRRSEEEKYYLTGGRLVAAKNFDLIIKACKKAKVDLKIFGTGIDEGALRNLADSSVEFLGKVSDKDLANYYAGARAFIAAQKDEDFGITAVESMLAGTPVVAYRGGGYLESVVEGKTGYFFDQLSVESLAEVLRRFDGPAGQKVKVRDCIKQAKKFSKDRFKKEMKDYVRKIYA